LNPELADEVPDFHPDDTRPPDFGRASLPPWVIASLDFQEHPRALHIVGVRRDNRLLFTRLDGIAEPEERARVFDEYMTVKFCLHDWPAHPARTGRSLKNSYVRFLRGWGVDSSSIEGAVLKGWVENRLGLPPRFHRGVIHPGTRGYLPFARDRMLGQARTNAIDQQLDVLFEYCQYETRRRGLTRLRLYRGTNDVEQHQIVRRFGPRDYVVVLNNLSSFSGEVERAWEFGSTVWEVSVPAQRIFYLAGLLPQSVLRGEQEHLVLGGQHRVREVLL
jgi:NAD+---dinitrogen-reductase ADP-D-ribosyltransferase